MLENALKPLQADDGAPQQRVIAEFDRLLRCDRMLIQMSPANIVAESEVKLYHSKSL